MDVQQAPQFTLEHIEGHPVSLSDFRGRTVVIALFGRNSADQMGAAVDHLRRHYDPQQLPILVVSDMGGIPRAARIPVRKQLKKNYKEAVESATAQLQAAGKPVPLATSSCSCCPTGTGRCPGASGWPRSTGTPRSC